MGRGEVKKEAAKTQIVSVQLGPEVVEALDAYAEELSRRADGVRITRSDALRLILRRGLEAA